MICLIPQELIDQIAVCTMDLDHVEAGCIGPARGRGPGIDHLPDLGDRKLSMLDERQRGVIAQHWGMGLEASLVQLGVLGAKP